MFYCCEKHIKGTSKKPCKNCPSPITVRNLTEDLTSGARNNSTLQIPEKDPYEEAYQAQEGLY